MLISYVDNVIISSLTLFKQRRQQGFTFVATIFSKSEINNAA